MTKKNQPPTNKEQLHKREIEQQCELRNKFKPRPFVDLKPSNRLRDVATNRMI